MPPDATCTDPIPLISERAADLALARLWLMRELEASLEHSRKALLGLDLPGIERGSSEQIRLLREIAATLPRGEGQQDRCSGFNAGILDTHLETEKELRRCRDRILAGTLLQGALLARARAKLHVLANMLAGSSLDYGPLLAARGLFTGRKAERREADSCRA